VLQFPGPNPGYSSFILFFPPKGLLNSIFYFYHFDFFRYLIWLFQWFHHHFHYFIVYPNIPGPSRQGRHGCAKNQIYNLIWTANNSLGTEQLAGFQHQIQLSGRSLCWALHMESLCLQPQLVCVCNVHVHLNLEQAFEMIRIIGKIMSIIVSDSSPCSLMFILHTFLMHRVPQTVFQYNSQPNFGSQIQYLCWQALTRLAPAT
jgi:hypothetical protein